MQFDSAIERASRALCELDGENPDALIYLPADLQTDIRRQAFGIFVNYHKVKPETEPRPLWHLYVPWAKVAQAALNQEPIDFPLTHHKIVEQLRNV